MGESYKLDLTIDKKACNTESMKKKLRHKSHRTHRTIARSQKPDETYIVAVRGWMLVVAFALMLGVGTVVGGFIRQQLDQATPTVAGASTQR